MPFQNNGYKFTGTKNEEILRQKIKQFTLKKKSEQCLDLPEEVSKRVDFKKKIPFADELLSYYTHGKDIDEHMMTYKKDCAVIKMINSVKYAQDLGEKHVIIYSDHIDPIEDSDCDFKITGSTNVDERAEILEDFMYNGGILGATIGSFSTGINMQFANHIVFNDLPWNPSQIIQAKARIKRVGQEKTCFYHYMVGSSADEIIMNSLERKIDNLRSSGML